MLFEPFERLPRHTSYVMRAFPNVMRWLNGALLQVPLWVRQLHELGLQRGLQMPSREQLDMAWCNAVLAIETCTAGPPRSFLPPTLHVLAMERVAAQDAAKRARSAFDPTFFSVRPLYRVEPSAVRASLFPPV